MVSAFKDFIILLEKQTLLSLLLKISAGKKHMEHHERRGEFGQV